MTIKDISRWQSCRLADRKTELPTASGIYAVLDQHSVMYIGRSGNLRRRWSSGHHRYHQAAKLKSPRLAWVLVSKREINTAEKAFIQRYQPVWNGTKVVESSPEWMSGWKLRVMLLLGAAILGACIGLISLRFAPPIPTRPDPPVSPRS